MRRAGAPGPGRVRGTCTETDRLIILHIKLFSADVPPQKGSGIPTWAELLLRQLPETTMNTLCSRSFCAFVRMKQR